MQFTVTPDKDGMMLSRLLLQLADVPQWAVEAGLEKQGCAGGRRACDGRCARAGRTADSRILAKKRPSRRGGKANQDCRLSSRMSM